MAGQGQEPDGVFGSGECQRLAAGELHLWLAARPELEAWAPLASLLSEEELAQLNRRLRRSDRELFLAAHGVLRVVLGTYLGCPPREVQLAAERQGRPVVVPPAGLPPLAVSLTHAAGMMACAVARGGLVGVDLEAVDRKASPLEIAGRFFAPTETAALEGLPPARQARRFFLYWTLKEALLKALGTGLTAPLSCVSLDVRGRGGWRVEQSSPLPQPAQEWWLASMSCGGRHVLSVALQANQGVRALRIRQVMPMADSLPMPIRCIGGSQPAAGPRAQLLQGAASLQQLLEANRLVSSPGASREAGASHPQPTRQ